MWSNEQKHDMTSFSYNNPIAHKKSKIFGEHNAKASFSIRTVLNKVVF